MASTIWGPLPVTAGRIEYKRQERRVNSKWSAWRSGQGIASGLLNGCHPAGGSNCPNGQYCSFQTRSTALIYKTGFHTLQKMDSSPILRRVWQAIPTTSRYNNVIKPFSKSLAVPTSEPSTLTSPTLSIRTLDTTRSIGQPNQSSHRMQPLTTTTRKSAI